MRHRVASGEKISMVKVILFAVIICMGAQVKAQDANAPHPYLSLIEPGSDDSKKQTLNERAKAALTAYQAAPHPDQLPDLVALLIRAGQLDQAWSLVEAEPEKPSNPYFSARMLSVNAKLRSAGRMSKLEWARTLRETCTDFHTAFPQDPDPLECLVKFHEKAPRIAGGKRSERARYLSLLAEVDPARHDLVKAELIFDEDPEAALGLIEHALGEETLTPQQLLQIAMVQGYFRQWDKVERTLDRVPDESELSALRYYQLGKMAAEYEDHLGDGEDALLAFLRGDTMIEGTDYRGPAHWRLGQIFRHQGRLDLAQLAFERSLEIMPSLKPAKKDLKALRKNRGDG